MEILSFIPEKLFIVIAATYILGMFFKSLDSKYFKDKFIPIALMIFAIIFSIVMNGFSGTSFLQGILCWGVAAGFNQILVQAKKEA